MKNISLKPESTKEHFKSMYHPLAECILITTLPEQMITYINPAFEELFGYTGAECIGQQSSLLYPDLQSSLPLDEQIKKSLAQDEKHIKTEQLMTKKDSGNFPAEMSISFVTREDKALSLVYIIRDITTHKLPKLALQESEARFRGFFEGAQDGILIADIETRQFMDANPAMCRMTGYTVDELKTLEIVDIHPQTKLSSITKQFLSQSKGKHPVAENIPVLRKDGTIFPADISGSQMKINGRPCRAGVFRDISQQSQTRLALLDARKAHQHLLDGIGDKFVIFSFIGLTGEVKYLSDGVKTVFGLIKENFIGSSWESTVAWLPESSVIAAHHINQQINGSSNFLQYEMSFIHPDGEPRTVRIASHPVRDTDGDQILINGILEDFTEQKQIEKQLILARKEAVKGNLAKSEFLSNMSHEIRTPMNAIIGFIELSLQAKLPSEVRKHLNIVKTSSRYLLELINNILDLSKIESEGMAIETIDFNLHDILFNLEVMLREKATEKGNRLSINRTDDIPDNLIGDPLRLGQILVNLVGNAIKFTQDGEITIHVSSTNTTDEFTVLQFSVQDTGTGIAHEKLDDIFKTFTQADTSICREFGGTGLGLPIARKLTQLMGGELGVTSSPDKGSIFSFSLPLGIQAVDEQSPIATELKGKKILITDDDTMVSKSLEKVLLYGGFEVETSELPSITMKMLRDAVAQKEPFDLILLDFMMPEQDGITTAKEIRNDPLLAHMPIIMLTGCGTDLEHQRATGVSINAFLRKPISIEILLKNIQMVFEQHEDDHHEVTPQPQIGSPEMLTGCKILLVEDDKFNQILAVNVLNNADIIVETANNGKEALALLDSSFDAILMDIQMPELDGLSTTVLIRRCETSKNPKCREDQELLSELPSKIYGGHIPIIAMTANAMSGDREKCLKAGMDDYITKPFQKEVVLQALAQFTNYNGL